MLSLQWHCENFKLLWPNRNFWMCWIYSTFSFVSSRWNSQTSGPLASSGPQNTPVLHHCCPTSHLPLSSCTAFNTALFYLAKCGLTGRPVTFQRCWTILIVRNQSFSSMCCERNTMAAVVLWPRGSSRRNPILKAIRVFEAAFLHSCWSWPPSRLQIIHDTLRLYISQIKASEVGERGLTHSEAGTPSCSVRYPDWSAETDGHGEPFWGLRAGFCCLSRVNQQSQKVAPNQGSAARSVNSFVDAERSWW